MKELTFDEAKTVNGGAIFLAPLLYTQVSITAGGLATALGIGTGVGGIVGGLIAIYSD